MPAGIRMLEQQGNGTCRRHGGVRPRLGPRSSQPDVCPAGPSMASMRSRMEGDRRDPRICNPRMDQYRTALEV